MRITLDGDRFELTPEMVRARIDGHVPEGIHEYWVEIDGMRWPVKQVISLATGVTNRQRFQSQASRRWLANLGFTLGKGDSAMPAARRPHRVLKPPSRPVAMTSGDVPDIVLIGCVKTKREHGAPARDLYVSDYFRKMRAYAEGSGRPWFILSAEHGLVRPDDWLEPYERYLPDAPHEYRRAWGRHVLEQLLRAVGPVRGLAVEIHAGSAYIDVLDEPLRVAGARVIDRLHGLSIGHRLSWYRRQQETAEANEQDPAALLRDFTNALTMNDLMATNGVGLRCPGMYSWWVDEGGAADLTRGLGHHVEAGLIYAGLAGATRSGGSTSANTLWGRIATMHLGKRHGLSTLRLSLGSVLAHAYDRSVIDEAELTRWMYAHLSVVTIPVADADTLGELETRILRVLDPPLNLAKVGTTPLRQQLSTLRKQYGNRRGSA